MIRSDAAPVTGTDLSIVFEDDWLIAVDKPSGLLSQPGIHVHDSVHSRLLVQRSDVSGPVLVHRLDMDTSGVMVLAKTREVHRHLQQQFERRQTVKRYVAILEAPPPGMAGLIDLPLRLDIDDRPHQIVCDTHGKTASTSWRRCDQGLSPCRVILHPRTGRTHQLRVHMAHPRGLNTPIIGDRLYGSRSTEPVHVNTPSQLMLHAERLMVTHPITGVWLCLEAAVPF